MENVPRENIDRGSQSEEDNKESSKGDNEASLLQGKAPLAITTSTSGKISNRDKAEGRRMDGGLRGWLIVLSSFMCNGLIFGVINSYSLVYVELQKILEHHGVPEASGKAG